MSRQEFPKEDVKCFPLHPEGMYQVQVMSATRIMGNKDYPQWRLRLESIDGSLLHQINFNEKSIPFIKGIYTALGCNNGYDPDDLSELEGKTCKVEIIHKDGYANVKTGGWHRNEDAIADSDSPFA